MSYSGKISTTGNSEAIRLDKNLFKQHPEFRRHANVRADVIGPGTMLIQVIDTPEIDNGNDPVVRAFLSFIEKDMCENPSNIAPVSASQMEEIGDLTAGIAVDENDDLS